jgi:hypothetical protein
MAFNNNDFATPHLEDDLGQILKWTKEVLFRTRKFLLYRGKSDLEMDCYVYEEFEKTCLNVLKGPAAFEEQGDHLTKRAYVQLLWNKATDTNIVAFGLSTNRSSVYTLMQNRFMGKYCWIDYHNDLITVTSKVSLTDLCNICTQNNLVFPALEAFEERLENPTLYFVFYDYFLKSPIGDDEWKQRTGMHPVVQQRKRKRTSIEGAAASTPIRRDKRMATPLDEAFALVMLKNNYFAW